MTRLEFGAIATALIVAPLLFAIPAASAAEAVQYRYDARGRLIEVRRTVDGGAAKVTTYAFDKADNRTAKTTS